jgi:hypothetical protein
MLAFTAERTIKKFFRIVTGGVSIVAHNLLSTQHNAKLARLNLANSEAIFQVKSYKLATYLTLFTLDNSVKM